MQTSIVSIVPASQAPAEPAKRASESASTETEAFEGDFDDALAALEVPKNMEGELLEQALSEQAEDIEVIFTGENVLEDSPDEVDIEVLEFAIAELPEADPAILEDRPIPTDEVIVDEPKVIEPTTVIEGGSLQTAKPVEVANPELAEVEAVTAETEIAPPEQVPELPDTIEPNPVKTVAGESEKTPPATLVTPVVNPEASVKAEKQSDSLPKMPDVQQTRSSILQQGLLQPGVTQPVPQNVAVPQQTASFTLKIVDRRDSTPKIELNWPAPPEGRNAPKVAQTTVVPAMIQAAKPEISQFAQAILAERERFSTEQSRAEPGLGPLSGLGAPRDVQNALAHVATVATTRADLPTDVARQIAETMARSSGKSVEIKLHPAELGRVKMTLSPAEAGMVVVVQAERPETMDLMRRNIEMLDSALANLGYEDVTFAFGDNSDRAQADRESKQTETATGLERVEANEVEVPQTNQRAPKTIGLDMRV